MTIPTNPMPTEPVATDVSISFKRPVDNKMLMWNVAGFAAFGVGVRMWHLGIQMKSVYWSELSTTYFDAWTTCSFFLVALVKYVNNWVSTSH
jgi:hypothetical protein